MNLKDLIAKMDAIEEASNIDNMPASQPSKPVPVTGVGNSNSVSTNNRPTGPAMPNQPTNHITQNVKPQADRPGLDPSGDPKLYDIQLWLQQNGYKDGKGRPIKPDGLNGDRTKFAYDQAMNVHNGVQDAQYPTTADASFGIGKAIGSGIDWIGTAWRNLKQGFNSSSPSAPPSMEESMKALSEKLRRIDENVEECGAMPMPGAVMSIGPQGHQGQQDNVSMTINVNGQGEGGLRSIMNILRDIEAGEEHADHQEPIMGADESQNIQGDESPLTVSPDEEMEEVIGDDEEGWGNSAHGGHKHHTHGLDAVTFSGDDMNSKGKISPVSRAPGTNPLREPSQFDEALVQRLTAMYQEIKEAGDKKTMSRAAKGVMKYGKDGMQALAKAGKEGKDLDKVRDKYNKYDEDAYDDINKGGFRFFQPTPWDQDGGDLGPNAALAGSAGGGNKNHWILSKMTPADYVTPGRPDIDRVNFLRKWARDHNDLTLQQWVQKGGNELKALVTGKPADKVTYDKMGPGNGIGANPTTPTKEGVNESADILKLAKMLRS